MTAGLASEVGTTTYSYGATVLSSSISNSLVRIPSAYSPRLVTTVEAYDYSAPSMADVNGNPGIAYVSSGIFYVRASDTKGTVWGNPVNTGATSNPGSFKMLMVNGRPAIGYRYYVSPVGTFSTSSVMFIRAADTNGSSWGSTIALATAANTNNTSLSFQSMAVVNGNPAVLFTSSVGGTNTTLKLIRASDASGISWGSPVNLLSVTNGWSDASLAVVNGNPAVCYTETGTLKYVRANDANGATWGSPVVVAVDGRSPLLAIVNGKPAVVCCNSDETLLKYVRAVDSSGATWQPPATVVARQNVDYPSLAIVNSRPVICCWVSKADGKEPTATEYIAANDADGNTWNTGFFISQTYQADGESEPSSLAVVSGVPFIARTSGGYLYFLRACFESRFTGEDVVASVGSWPRRSAFHWWTSTVRSRTAAADFSPANPTCAPQSSVSATPQTRVAVPCA